MNVSTFLNHWNIKENPFLAEEARQDQVFAKMAGSTKDRAASPLPQSQHPDFEKILGDPTRPATATVFGEKGAGKTALRLQIEEAIRKHNGVRSDAKTLVVPYDDLNPILDRFVRRHPDEPVEKALEKFRLVDHLDGILSVAVPQLIDGVLRPGSSAVDVGQKPGDVLKRLPPEDKRRWVALQLFYDRSDRLTERGRELRRKLRIWAPTWVRPTRWAAALLWILFAVLLIVTSGSDGESRSWLHALGVWAIGGVAGIVSVRAILDFMGTWRRARRLSKQLAVVDRTKAGWRDALNRTPWSLIDDGGLPTDDLDDSRYRLLADLVTVIAPFGYNNMLVLIDRVDEPTLISGDTGRMKSVIWPLFNNKFLQHEHIALKMMLPIELRHELHRQSSEFFQEARMDKQNLIDRLTWSGTTLYDLCSTRLRACSETGSEFSLIDLFDDTVNRQDVVDALDQMRQPRDAFKMMYQLIQVHCGNTTDDEENWKIPRLVLDQVRRDQVDRLEALQRGLGPA